MRVLVVEDDERLRSSLARRLKKNGYLVALAENGRIGLEKAYDFRPDIILSDWMMPEMPGRELCRRIKAEPTFATTFFILLTAKDHSDDKVQGLDAGADGYLVKPCEPNELSARLRAAERVISLQRSLNESNQQLVQALDRISRELEITSEIQSALLPECLPEVPGFGFAAYYQPSTECGGDYYDVLQFADGRFGIFVADVSGHGTPAMVAMAVLRSLVHLSMRDAETPGQLLTIVNRLLDQHLPTAQFVTAFCAMCDPRTGQLQYSSAGHNAPLRVNRSARDVDSLSNCKRFPLKIIPDTAYEDFALCLLPGEALVLYTDGITEARNPSGEFFGTERLVESSLAGDDDSADGILQSIIACLGAFRGDAPLADDETILLVHRLHHNTSEFV